MQKYSICDIESTDQLIVSITMKKYGNAVKFVNIIKTWYIDEIATFV